MLPLLVTAEKHNENNLIIVINLKEVQTKCFKENAKLYKNLKIYIFLNSNGKFQKEFAKFLFLSTCYK